jgi:transglutaminase-like putative cysteine protease
MTDTARPFTLGVTAALAAVAGLAFVPLAEPRTLTVVPFAAILPTAITVIARGRGSLLVALAGWVAAGLPLALTLGTGPGNIPEVVRGGLVDGFRMALTEALPLRATPAVLFWIFTLVWWAAYWAARAADPRVTPLLALLPPGLVLVTGVAFGASQPGRGLPVAALFAGVAAFLLAVRGGRSLRRTLVAAIVCSAVVLGAVAVAARLPYEGARPVFDPRALVHRPEQVERQLSPLAYASLWAAEPPRRLLRVSTASPANQRLAVFDRYDGLDWSSDASYVPTGPRLSTGPVRPGRSVRETVTVDDLPLAWLPAPDRPTGLTGTTARVDRTAGTLTTAGGHAATGLRYTVTSRVPRLTAAEAAAATPAYGGSYASYLDVPADVPSSILGDADRLTQGGAVPYQRLLTLQDRLRTHYRYDVRAAPGRTAGHLRFFYDKSHQGTADQFATVFALMARHLGFPSRVVVGFTPGHPVGAGRYEVTTNDVVVWPEVALRGLGWVPFYPVPQPGGGGRTVGRSVGETPDRAALDQTVAAVRSAPAPRTPGDTRPAPARTTRPADRWILAVILLVFLLIGYFGPGPAVRALRRQRRRSGPPYAQVVGAWQEAIDALARLPRTGDLTALTAEEVAERARGWLGGDAGRRLESLARHLSASVFSAEPTGEVASAAAWLIVGRVRDSVDHELTRGQRIREKLRPPWTALRRSAAAVPARTPVKEAT